MRKRGSKEVGREGWVEEESDNYYRKWMVSNCRYFTN